MEWIEVINERIVHWHCYIINLFVVRGYCWRVRHSSWTCMWKWDSTMRWCCTKNTKRHMFFSFFFFFFACVIHTTLIKQTPRFVWIRHTSLYVRVNLDLIGLFVHRGGSVERLKCYLDLEQRFCHYLDSEVDYSTPWLLNLKKKKIKFPIPIQKIQNWMDELVQWSLHERFTVPTFFVCSRRPL